MIFYTKEKTGAKYKATIKDADGNAIALDDLIKITLTLYDVETDENINSRSKQDVKNKNDVTIAATGGEIIWLLQADDNPICGDTVRIGKRESHRGLFEYEYNGDGSPGKHELEIQVLNLGKVS